MKFYLLIIVVSLLTFTSCNEDEETSCFDCTIDGVTTEYCHNGDTVTVTDENGDSTEVELNGASWSVYKIAAESACD